MPRSDELPARRFPCGECPVRVDTGGKPRSKFPASRWEELRKSIEERPGEHAGPGAPLFGCHEGEPGTGADLLCAGWAASFGLENVRLRVEIALGRVSGAVLYRGENWPELHEDWDEMVSAHLLRPGDSTDHLPAPLAEGIVDTSNL